MRKLVAALLLISFFASFAPPPALKGSKIRVYFHNKTKGSIYAAVRFIPYGSSGNSFVGKQWYTISPGEKAYLFDTENLIFYYYAESTTANFFGQKRQWGGSYYWNIKGVDYGFAKCTMGELENDKGSEDEFTLVLNK